MGLIEQGFGGLWNLVFYTVAFMLVLTPVVFIHELGHFLVARWCGVTVRDFSIGFGREIFGFHDRHGTRWRFGWIPIGGYVKFMDDENSASGPSREALARLSPAERAGAFQTKPVGVRAAIVAAGPIANFLLAIVIFTLTFIFIGERVIPPRVGALDPGGPAVKAGFKLSDLIVSIDGQQIRSLVDLERTITLNADRELTFEVDRAGALLKLKATPAWSETADASGRKRVTIGIEPPAMPPRVGALVRDKPAAKVGFEVGDVIVGIDGKPTRSFAELHKIVGASTGKELTFEIDRAGTLLQLKVTPAEGEMTDSSGKKIKYGMIGIRSAPEGEFTRFPPVEAFVHAVGRTYTIIADSLTALYQIVTGRMPADQLSGPVGIAVMSGQAATWGPAALITWVALISVAIGFFNLLPVPVLDGGHLLFYAIEAVRRKPLSERTQEIGFRIGLALVLLLFVFVTAIDFRRLLGLG